MIFILPILGILIIPSVFLYRSGESFVGINEIENNPKVLVGYGYNEDNYEAIKIHRLKTKERAEVLAIGSSRTLSFRHEMFDVPFYNAGFVVTEITDFKQFLAKIPKKKQPKYLIMCLDQWMFNENWDRVTNNNLNMYQNPEFHFFPKMNSFKKVYRDLFHGKYSFEDIQPEGDYKYVGLLAHINEEGQRMDGSRYYGGQFRKLMNNDDQAWDYEFNETLEKINQGDPKFNYKTDINPNALEVLKNLLAYCHDQNIHVIGYFPPFGDKVITAMREQNAYGYMDQLMPSCKPIFEKFGFELYNYPTYSSCGSNDSEAIDGFHGGDITYLRLLINMLEQRSILNNTTSKSRLLEDLANAPNRFEPYPLNKEK